MLKGTLMAKLSNLAHRDIETVIHPYTNLAVHREIGPLVLEEARGIHVYDNEGKEYIEEIGRASGRERVSSPL